MKDCALKSILIKKKIRLNIFDDADENLISESLCKIDKKYYQQMIKNLFYLSLETRLNILFAIAILN